MTYRVETLYGAAHKMKRSDKIRNLSVSLRSLYRLQNVEGALVGVERIQAAVVAYTAPILGVAGLGIAALYVEQDALPLKYGVLTGLIASIFLILAPLFAVVSGNIPRVGMFLIFTVWASLSTGALETSGIQSGQIALLVQLPVWATFFWGRRGAVSALVLVFISLATMLVVGPTAILNADPSRTLLMLADALMAVTAASIVLVIVYIQEYLLANLADQKTKVEKSSAAKSEFLSSMSHELRTPMNAILGFAQLLLFNPKEPLSHIQKESVDSILRGGRHLLELIDQVLELNKIEAGKMSLNVDHVSTRNVIDESLDLVRSRADMEGIEIIDQTTGCDLPLLWTDSTRLVQVLLNLLSNAVKYNREGGTVTLTSQEMPNRMLRISVIDTGRGIPVEKRDSLFRPFERLGREAGNIEGTGIGLTITRQILGLLGGQVGYESEEGKGSTFWADVPMSEHDDAGRTQLEIAKSTGKMMEKFNQAGSRYTVLYIEDNPDNMRLMEVIVGRQPNTRLLTAYNAEQGIDLAKAERPDLILMDINLPGMNGIEALKQLQKAKETKGIPVIAITAAAMPRDIQAGMASGFKDYITKPINVPEVTRIIEETLNGIDKPV